MLRAAQRAARIPVKYKVRGAGRSWFGLLSGRTGKIRLGACSAVCDIFWLPKTYGHIFLQWTHFTPLGNNYYCTEMFEPFPL